ncbi:hypothetical protein S40288_07615 [Stachybotrys chartarum IBT 40288]|nr:hypothetical protein S40288_07615 [Stachybotrys chartarum IBT 40288]
MAINGTKRRKLAHDGPDEEAAGASGSSKTAQKAFFKNAASWDLEQDYESRPRKGKKHEKESNRLPTKSADGRLEVLRELEEDNLLVGSDDDWLDGREAEVESEPEPAKQEAPVKSEAQQIMEAQEELAKLAMAMNENPEEHVGAFKALARIGSSRIHAVRVLSLLTQMAVYKDVIPGYRIRPQTADGPREKVSKDVRTLRQYEQALVAGYQGYIRELAKCAKLEVKPGPGGQSLSSVAIKCACTLITSVPHFNFRTDLLKILVGKLSKRRLDKDSIQCQLALETLFRDDEEGRPSMEAVSLLSKMMKARDFQVDETVVNLFLNLRLLSEFSGKASRDRVERSTEPGPRKKKEFRTKRERKTVKEQKAFDKDMAQADAMVSHEERERMQSETLKLVFASYFRILKLRVPHLMGAVLEGLAKYAHLINQDFFGDLLEALKDLIRHSDEDAQALSDDDAPEGNGDSKDLNDDEDEDDGDAPPVRNLTRESLLCTVTAFALLAGQDAHNSRNALHLDLSFFITHLYRSLLTVSLQPDLELTRLANSATDSKINVQTTTVLLLRSLTAILLPPYNIRSVPPLRIAAFTKQLMAVAMHLPEKSCQGVLALLGDVARTHGKKVNSMWNTEERKGDGKFIAVSDSVEGSNPFAATVWEGELLRKHFSPNIREGVKLLEKGMSG